MKRFHLTTLMLLVVIAALGIALFEQGRRAARRMAVLEAKLARANEVVEKTYKLGIIEVNDDVSVAKREFAKGEGSVK